MATWEARLVKIQILRTGRGTGWAVGDTGVLTARSIVEPLLANDTSAPGPGVEVMLGSRSERSFEAHLVWDDALTGLALLAISDRQRTTWHTLLRGHDQPPLAYPPADISPTIAIRGLPGGTARRRGASNLTWMMARPDTIPGTLSPPDDAGRAIADLDHRDTPKPARRHGMPGAAALSTGSDPMLLGIVTGKPRRRHQGRVLVSSIPRLESNDQFRDALESVGASGGVVSMDGPTRQEFVAEGSLDAALELRRIADIDDPGFFGTRVARSDVAGEDNAYATAITRAEASVLRGVVDAALAGEGPRFIVVRGPTAAGKSRLTYEVLRSHPGLASYQVLEPVHQRSVLDIPSRLIPEHCLIWMDNLQDYPSNSLRHEETRQLLDTHPGIIVLVTMLESPDHSGAAPLVDSRQQPHSDADLSSGYPLTSASLSGVQTTLDDERLTVTVVVDTTVTVADTTSLPMTARRALTECSEQGLGLGEYLSGYQELAEHYTAAPWPTRALVGVVRDWDRSGVGEAIPISVARALWQRIAPNHLPRTDLQKFSRMNAAESDALWATALKYACDTVVGTGSLLRLEHGCLASTEFTRAHIDRNALHPQVWDYLLNEHRTTRMQRLTMGVRALESGTPQRARRAFESVLSYRADDVLNVDQLPLMEVIARRGIALYHSRIGRDEQAIMVYTNLVDTFGRSKDPDIGEQVAQALLGIGITFSNLGSHGQAVSAYTELVKRYGEATSPILDEYVAKGLLGQATTLGQLGRRGEESSAYADLVKRYDGEKAPTVAAIVDVARAVTAPIVSEQ